MSDKVEIIITLTVLSRIRLKMDFFMLNVWFLLWYNSLFKFGCFVVDGNLIDDMAVAK